uniref:hypothetical protein n=1 Tax=Amycolatopsis sp. CA-151526 TaxID=3239921 RepID=UPI003F49A304
MKRKEQATVTTETDNNRTGRQPSEARTQLAEELREYLRGEGSEYSVVVETPSSELRALLKWGALIEDSSDGVPRARIHPAFYAGVLWAADFIARDHAAAGGIMAATDPPDSGELIGHPPISSLPLP